MLMQVSVFKNKQRKKGNKINEFSDINTIKGEKKYMVLKSDDHLYLSDKKERNIVK